MSTSDFEVRFGVRGLHSKVSASWRLWAVGDDVYVAARRIAGIFKLSLHASGIRRVAFTAESGMKNPESEERLIRKWPSPIEFSAGWKVGAAVVVPYVSIERPLKGYTTNDDDVIWIAAPEAGQQAVVFILFGPPGVDAIGTLTPDHTILASHQLPRGEILWLAARYGPLPAAESQILEDQLGVRLEAEDPSGVFGANIIRVGGQDYPTLTDLALGEENVLKKAKLSEGSA